LRDALSEIIRRHEILRTTFSTRDGRPVQVATPPGAMLFPMVDLETLPAADYADWQLDGAPARLDLPSDRPDPRSSAIAVRPYR
jgi:hypothetical protein